MQPSLTISSTSQAPNFSWKNHSYPATFSLQVPNFHTKPRFPGISFKAFSLSSSFEVSHNSSFEQPIIDNDQSPLKARLPVVIKRDGKVYKYFWGGDSSLVLVCVDIEDPPVSFHGFDDGIRRLISVCGSGVRDFFIPKQVSENYIDYVKWKFLHRVFSSALQVLATQAMFRAIGVGHAQSLPSAAALNWVLKDGLGRLSRCIYTACVGSAFDTNLKRVRFATSVMFTLSIGVELMTPAFPHCFLLLASLANIAKQISLACYLATGTSVHRSFALADNLGEVSAKAQIQTVCFDNLGLLLAASLNVICKNNQRSAFCGLTQISAIDLYGIYQSLKHVHLQTLTKDRLEIILNTWIRQGYIPSPAEVSKLEGISLLDNAGRNKGEWPIRIGCLDPSRRIPLVAVLAMRSLTTEDFYFICMETYGRPRKSAQRGILLSLREGAGTLDIITGLLQECYIREALLSTRNKWESVAEGCDIPRSFSREWSGLIENSKGSAQGDMSALHEQIIKSGWAAKNILLDTQEQVRYSFIGEKIRSTF